MSTQDGRELAEGGRLSSTEFMSKHHFERDFPLTRTHCGLPLGNGNMGVLVWGGGRRLCLTVNRSDWWDHRQGEMVEPGQHYRDLVAAYDPYDITPVQRAFVRRKMPLDTHVWPEVAPPDQPAFHWRPTRLPAGCFELVLTPACELQRIVLDYPTGVATVHAGTGKIRLLQCLSAHTLLIEDPDGLIADVVARPAWEWVGDWLARGGYQPPRVFASSDECGWKQDCPEDPGLTACCRRTASGREVSLRLDGEPSTDRPTDFAPALAEASAWWGNYWADAPSISLPEPFLNEFFTFALYKFACATRPGGIASGLQGPWVEEYQKPPWSADYHFNVNVQQVYALAFAAGKYDHALPLFDMLESEPFQRVMRENARNLFGIEDGLLLTHAVDDRGRQCGGISATSVLDFGCGGWTAQLYWLYFQHTGDTTFLRERAFPFIRGVMRVFEACLEEFEGRLSIPLSTYPEYGCIFKLKKDGREVSQCAGRDPSFQLACAHMLADMLIEASGLLGREPEAAWLDLKRRLPRYCAIGASGQERIALWEGQDLDVCHRHHSHLSAVAPFDSIGAWNEDDRRILENTLDHWIARGMGEWSEWCYPWAAQILTRLDCPEAPAHLFRLWRDLFVNEGFATVYLPRFRGLSAHRRADMKKPKETSEVMQLDGTMSAASALMEMLAHTRGEVVYLFRGVPEAWKEVSFENIHLPGGFRISGSRNGRVTVCSRHGGTLRLDLEGVVHTLQLAPGETGVLDHGRWEVHRVKSGGHLT